MEIAELILGLIIFFVAVCALNYFTVARLEQVKLNLDIHLPTASILIPARNEAHNLVHLIPSLLASNYKAFEILLLDDESDDQTENVAVTLLEKGHIPFRVITGKKWNSDLGISGKNYACQQLAELAKGEILIFCDADVTISKDTVQRTLSLMQQNLNASGLSGLPQISCAGFFENLVFPWIMQIPLMISLPLGFAWRLPLASVQMANGQWLAIRKKAYHKIGGHHALATTVVEDMQIAKNLVNKSLGGLIPVLASKDLTVRMYASWSFMVAGFSKNLVQLYGGRPIIFILLVAFVNFVFFFPLWSLPLSLTQLIIGLSAIFSLRVMVSLAFGNSLIRSVSQFFLHWLSLLVVNYFSLLILYNYLKQITHWKGRKTQQAGVL